MTAMKSLHEHLASLEHTDPKRTAISVHDDTGDITEEISRAQLRARVEATAAHLHRKGLRAGDRVALALGNSADLLILSWAAWSVGIATVPLDMKRDTEELRAYKIRTSGAAHVASAETFPTREAASADVLWMPDLSHDALILFTSGTTAYPKGARLTLGNLVVNAEGIIAWLGITQDDCFLVELPLHHINSTTFCLASLVAGARIALPPRYSNSHFWKHAAGSGATLTSVVPSIIFDQLRRTEEFDAVRDRLALNRIQLGSAPVVVSDALAFIRKFSIPLHQGYGQTETALRVTGVPMDLTPDLYQKLVAENSIGTPMPWAEVEITDVEGHILGEGEQGELVVNGPAVMQGYIGDEPAFRNGYFLTGDIGYWKEIDDRRFFFLIGRAKEIIIKGGVNISPVAVENALKKISADIEQAYVIGVADERYGEDIGAVVVWKDAANPPAALRRLKLALLLGHKALRTYETPKYLISVHAEELPMTSTGKVQRITIKKNFGNTLEPVDELMQSEEFRFVVISPQSPLTEASRALYNHCWQPIIKSGREYKKYLNEYVTLGAVKGDGTLAGQISFSYADKKITCVSICSAAFAPKPVPAVQETPDAEFVRNYLLAGNDSVMNFHRALGAELVEVIPQGRPEDKSSLGYTMLLRYPLAETIALAGPASHQLIQAVRIIASDCGIAMYAFSRPGGLAAYLARAS